MIDTINPVVLNNGEVVLHCGNWEDELPAMSPRSVDLILTDPPFFMPAKHYRSRVNWQRKWADTSLLGTFWRRFLDVAIPLLKPSGHLIMFCNHESYPVFYPLLYGRFDSCKALVWNKNSVGLGRVWRNQHELIIAARWNSSEFNEDGKLRADVLSHSATPSASREHPVEKPESLLLDLILPTTLPGGVVLDPFSGSGTTGLAAIKAGRKFVGVELDPEYFISQQTRFVNSIAQPRLFEAPVAMKTPEFTWATSVLAGEE